MSFKDRSIEALKAYWRTAVFIDDAAMFNNAARVSSLQAPGRGTQASQPEQASDFQGAPLDVSDLVGAFLEQDILCTVLSNRDVLLEKQEALLRSDILILDWKLDDDGDITTGFIQYCATHHKNALHMICIYTSENDLEAIKQKLKDSSPNLEELNDKADTYSIGSTYILVVNKNTSVTNFGSRRAELEKLPELLLKEFAPIVGGLLRNAVFHSIGAIRSNTHALLDRFHPDLDPAFVTHRIYSNPCEDTEKHIIPLICSQLDNILTQENISQQLNAEKIQCWLHSNDIQVNLPEFPQSIQNYIDSNITDILKKGIRCIPKFDNSSEKKDILRNSLMTSFFGAEDGQKSDVKLAMLMSCEQYYSDVCPVLKSGIILQQHGSDSYFICIQPPCDCVRIKEDGRCFLFARASKVTANAKFSFSFITKHDEIIFLKKDQSIYNATLIKFVPENGIDFISAKFNSRCKEWYFEDAYGHKYDFLFQLNDSQALRCIQESSNNLSRIGLMESDWQRRCTMGEHQ